MEDTEKKQNEESRIKNFRDLKIWQRAIKLVEKIYGITKKFPNTETFGLILQMKRASVSIPSNIAEGFARSSNKEYQRFLFISRGSCAELVTQLIISSNLGYICKNDANMLIDETEQISKMTMSLINKVHENIN